MPVSVNIELAHVKRVTVTLSIGQQKSLFTGLLEPLLVVYTIYELEEALENALA